MGEMVQTTTQEKVGPTASAVGTPTATFACALDMHARRDPSRDCGRLWTYERPTCPCVAPSFSYKCAPSPSPSHFIKHLRRSFSDGITELLPLQCRLPPLLFPRLSRRRGLRGLRMAERPRHVLRRGRRFRHHG
ncbi:hypothetical protein GW17_00011797 [Ensete ventricosum]|nr:hypothetical protein GW17_00011797 [Ensete ventricosum]